MAAEIFTLLNILVLLHVGCPLYDEEIMRACFFNSKSRLRMNEAKFSVRDIDFTLCTHYVYGYAKVDPRGKTIFAEAGAQEDGLRGLYSEFNAGKRINPLMKTILAVGGVEPRDSEAFADLYAAERHFMTFAQNAVTYVRAHGFNGIHIHWQVTSEELGKIALTNLLKELRKMIDYDTPSRRLLLSVLGHAQIMFIQLWHNVTEIKKYVDYVFVSTEVLATLNTASFFGALFYGGDRQFSSSSINESIKAWYHHGMPYEKLVMSLTVLGHYVRLRSASEYTPYSLGTPEVLRGNKYNLTNRLALPEICEMMGTSQLYYDSVVKNAYLVRGDEWVGFLDAVSLLERIEFVRFYDVGGIQLANLDEDDFSGRACRAGRFPLVTAMRNKLDPRPSTVPVAATTPRRRTEPNIATTQGGLTEHEQLTTSPLSSLGEMTEHDMSTTLTPKVNQMITTSKSGPVIQKSNKFQVFQYIVFVLLFTMGHILGYLFINYLRNNNKPEEEKHKRDKIKESKPGRYRADSSTYFPKKLVHPTSPSRTPTPTLKKKIYQV